MRLYIELVYLLIFFAVNYSQQHFNDSEDSHCPPWQGENDATGNCECGNPLLQVVHCQEETHNLQLYACCCMTYSHKTLVGSCQYTCERSDSGYFFSIPVNSTSKLNEFMCSYNNRQGQLCGSCMPGYAPPVYSYYLSCVNCTTSNWGKYTAVSLLPVTASFVFVLSFRLSATLQKLNGFILCIQILASPPNMRSLADYIEIPRRLNKQQKRCKSSSRYFSWNIEPGFSASCLHSFLPAASHKHSPRLSSGLSQCCLPSPTHRTLLTAGPAL